jgi:hypothetical protein
VERPAAKRRRARAPFLNHGRGSRSPLMKESAGLPQDARPEGAGEWAGRSASRLERHGPVRPRSLDASFGLRTALRGARSWLDHAPYAAFGSRETLRPTKGGSSSSERTQASETAR